MNLAKKLSVIVIQIVSVGVLGIFSSTATPRGSGTTETCPQASIAETSHGYTARASITCLEGMTALCQWGSDQPCTCKPGPKRTRECAGSCSIDTLAGQCSITCAPGHVARCVMGRVVMFAGKPTPPRCDCL